MYNLIVPFPARTKAPLEVPVSVDSGVLEADGRGTYKLTDAQGQEIASGLVDGVETDSAIAIREWKTVDGNDLNLLPGNYSLEFLLTVTTDGLPRTYPYSIILNVPGSRVFAHYPTVMDLQVFLVAARMLTNPPSADDMLLDLDAACQTAVSEWERMTGWFPFLALPSALPDTTRTVPFPYQPGGDGMGGYSAGLGGYSRPQVDLGAGLLRCSAVLVGATSYTLGPPPAQAQLLPVNAPDRGKPFEYLGIGGGTWFGGGYGNSPQGLTITGRWGYCDSLPADVWNVLLGIAGAEIAPGLSLAVTGGYSSFEEAGVTEQVSKSPFVDSLNRWSTQASRALPRYRRCRIA